MAAKSLPLRLIQRRRVPTLPVGRCSSPWIARCLSPRPCDVGCPSSHVSRTSSISSLPRPSSRGLSTVSSQHSIENQEAEGIGKSRLPSDFLSALRNLHPDLQVSANTYDLDSHGRGESYHPPAPPDAVIYPTSEEEIRDVLRLCVRERRVERDDGTSGVVEIVSIIPYGAGTSLEGHLHFLFPPGSSGNDANSDDGEMIDIPSSYFEGYDGVNSYRKVRVIRKGGISIDMSNFQSIGEVGPGDNSVTVGAGVTRNTLNEALRCVSTHRNVRFTTLL